jgi:hypothetical protein
MTFNTSPLLYNNNISRQCSRDMKCPSTFPNLIRERDYGGGNKGT